MPTSTPALDPFPFEAVRDLVGILRALYAADKHRGAGARRLAAIRAIALELRRATDLAREHPPGTPGHAAASNRAELAVRRLGDLVDVTTPLEPTLLAAGERVRAGAVRLSEREAGRRARSIRS
jgi:hypothetical protein